MHDFIHDTEIKIEGSLLRPFKNMIRSIQEARRAYRNGLIYGARFLSYRTVANKKDSYSGDPYNSYVAYFHHHTLIVDCATESISAAGDTGWNTPHEVVHTKWRADSPLLTVTVKNYDEAQKFENTQNKFVGLYIIDVSTKRVYRLAGNPVGLVRIQNGMKTGLPWLNPNYDGKTSMMQDGDTDGFLGKFLDYA